MILWTIQRLTTFQTEKKSQWNPLWTVNTCGYAKSNLKTLSSKAVFALIYILIYILRSNTSFYCAMTVYISLILQIEFDLKNHIHVKKVGHTSEFLFDIYWWTWKTIKKNCWSGPCWIFLKKNIKKNTCRYHYQNLDDMIYHSWDIEQNILKFILKLVTLVHFLLFYPLKNPKTKILKNEKNCRYHHFTHVYQKSQYVMYGSSDTEWHRHKVFAIWAIFCPFINSPPPPSSNKNQNFENIYIYIYEKSAWRHYAFIHICVPWMKIIWYMVPEI